MDVKGRLSWCGPCPPVKRTERLAGILEKEAVLRVGWAGGDEPTAAMKGGAMNEPVVVLVHLRESLAPYRRLLCDSEQVTYRFCRDRVDVEREIGLAHVILGTISFPAALLRKAERLCWFQVAGAGVDAVAESEALPPQVLLTRVDTGFGVPIAEYVLGHLLALTQRVDQVRIHQFARRWETLRTERLSGTTMGIAGTGAVGRVVAKRARALEMRTVGLSRRGAPVDGFDRVLDSKSFNTFLSELDSLVLCLPLTPATSNLIDRGALSQLKRSAVLINVGRGGLVDEQALVSALDRGDLRAAILDVFREEPLPVESPLWTTPGVVITSHQAGINDPRHVASFFLDNLARYLHGGRLRGCVDRSRGY